MGLTVLPLSLIGSLLLLVVPSIGILILKFASLLLKLLWPILTFLANFHYAIWQQSVPNNWLLLMALIGILILIAPRGLPRWLGLLWIAPLIFFKAARPESGQFLRTNPSEQSRRLAPSPFPVPRRDDHQGEVGAHSRSAYGPLRLGRP